MAKTLDVICIGRSSVDLYGQQVGARLEEMASFAKYVGGCPTNISVGAARLGFSGTSPFFRTTSKPIAFRGLRRTRRAIAGVRSVAPEPG